VAENALSSQGIFDEGFTRIHIGRIADGHRDHRDSRRFAVDSGESGQVTRTGVKLPEQPATLGRRHAHFRLGQRRFAHKGRCLGWQFGQFSMVHRPAAGTESTDLS